MKKLLSISMVVIMLLALVACGQPTAPIPNPPLVLGEKYLSDLDYEQALLQFDQAIEIEPKNPRGYLGKADALLHLDRQADAASALADGAKAVQRDQREALQSAQAEVVKSPVDGYIGLSSAYEKLGWREIALLLLQRVCEELPEESRLKVALGRLRTTIASEGMPDVENKALDEAKALLDAMGITYEIQYEGGGKEGNVVIGQKIKSVVLRVAEGTTTAEANKAEVPPTPMKPDDTNRISDVNSGWARSYSEILSNSGYEKGYAGPFYLIDMGGENAPVLIAKREHDDDEFDSIPSWKIHNFSIGGDSGGIAAGAIEMKLYRKKDGTGLGYYVGKRIGKSRIHAGTYYYEFTISDEPGPGVVRSHEFGQHEDGGTYKVLHTEAANSIEITQEEFNRLVAEFHSNYIELEPSIYTPSMNLEEHRIR